jgi:hypothetical protein
MVYVGIFQLGGSNLQKTYKDGLFGLSSLSTLDQWELSLFVVCQLYNILCGWTILCLTRLQEK